jgi:hypothetical protein
VDGEASGGVSIGPLSKDMILGLLLNWVRWTTVGSSCPLRADIENLRRGLAGGEVGVMGVI